MEIIQRRYCEGYGWTEHIAVTDEDGPEEVAFNARTPTLSALLEAAVQDMDAHLAKGRTSLTASEQWRAQLGTNEEAQCAACLAGAMLSGLGAGQVSTVTAVMDSSQLGRYERERERTQKRGLAIAEAGRPPAGTVAAKLWAVDDMRQGKMRSAAVLVYGERATNEIARTTTVARRCTDTIRSIEKAQRLDDWSESRAAYSRLAGELRTAGL